MYEELKKLLEKSHSPYSQFKVAAIVIDNNGKKYAGVNVETSTFTPTICAERNAIFSAITKGLKWGDVKEVHVLGSNNRMDKEMFATPCGVCRQVIFEASNAKAKVFIYNNNDEVKIEKINDLLLDGFSGEEI